MFAVSAAVNNFVSALRYIMLTWGKEQVKGKAKLFKSN